MRTREQNISTDLAEAHTMLEKDSKQCQRNFALAMVGLSILVAVCMWIGFFGLPAVFSILL